MEVILISKVARLGEFGEKVNVKAGYARNYLLPYKKAIRASAENIAHFEEKRAEYERINNEILGKARQRAEAFETLNRVTIRCRSGINGKLFGSVGVRDIVEAISAQGLEISKDEIRLLDGAIHALGDYEITLSLHPEISVPFLVVVESE